SSSFCWERYPALPLLLQRSVHASPYRSYELCSWSRPLSSVILSLISSPFRKSMPLFLARRHTETFSRHANDYDLYCTCSLSLLHSPTLPRNPLARVTFLSTPLLLDTPQPINCASLFLLPWIHGRVTSSNSILSISSPALISSDFPFSSHPFSAIESDFHHKPSKSGFRERSGSRLGGGKSEHCQLLLPSPLIIPKSSCPLTEANTTGCRGLLVLRKSTPDFRGEFSLLSMEPNSRWKIHVYPCLSALQTCLMEGTWLHGARGFG
ncbi:unnamed protein product, partial [Linum tenue]